MIYSYYFAATVVAAIILATLFHVAYPLTTVTEAHYILFLIAGLVAAAIAHTLYTLMKKK